MAEDDFLKTLSKGGITQVIRDLGLLPRNTGKEMRAALIEHVGQGHYVLPAAHFALRAAELTELQKQIKDDCTPETDEIDTDVEKPDGSEPGTNPGDETDGDETDGEETDGPSDLATPEAHDLRQAA